MLLPIRRKKTKNPKPQNSKPEKRHPRALYRTPWVQIEVAGKRKGRGDLLEWGEGSRGLEVELGGGLM